MKKTIKPNKLEVKRSHTLMEAWYNVSVDTYKMFGLAASKFKNQLHYSNNNDTTINPFYVVIDRHEVEEVFPSFKKSHLIKQRFKKIAQETQANSSIAVPIKKGNQTGWKFIPIIEEILHYEDTQQIIINFHPDAEKHLNPNYDNGDLFDLDEVKNWAFFTSMKQVGLYNICHKNIAIGWVKKSIPELRKLTNTPDDKYKTIGHFISRVIKYQIDVINVKSILSIDFTLIKTGRKITHIKFEVVLKKSQALEQIELQFNNLKAILTSIGISTKKLNFINKFPIVKVIEAAKYTQNLISKNKVKNTPEACFIYAIRKMNKIEMNDYDTVINFIKLLPIKQKGLLQQEFHNQLSIDEKSTYSSISTEQNKIKKAALLGQYNKHYHHWIFNNKLNLSEDS